VAAHQLVQPYSVSKPFAAVCALLLADRGQLDLDAPVQRYWPQFRAHADVRQVLRRVPSTPAVVNGRAWRTAQVPAVNGHGTARGAAGLYAALLRGELLSPGLLGEATMAQCSGVDAVWMRCSATTMPGGWGSAWTLTVSAWGGREAAMREPVPAAGTRSAS
jgi:hypothetical protein